MKEDYKSVILILYMKELFFQKLEEVETKCTG